MEFENLNLLRLSVTVNTEAPPGFDYYDLHHGFLVSRGIIPHEWTTENPRITPAFSELTYDNNVSLFMDDDTFQVSQTQDLEFGGKFEPPAIMTKVLLAADRIELNEVYISWSISIPCKGSRSWLLDRFLCSEVVLDEWSDPEGSIRLKVGVDDLVVFIGLSSDQSANEDGEQIDAVDAFCTVQHDPFEGIDELIGWLSEWRKHESIMLGVLKSLLGVNHD